MLTYSIQMRTSPNQTFFDPSVAHSAFAISLPDPLRIRVTGVTQGQFNIYKDFGMPVFRFQSGASV